MDEFGLGVIQGEINLSCDPANVSIYREERSKSDMYGKLRRPGNKCRIKYYICKLIEHVEQTVERLN
jgi:hypothetical protein